MGSLLSLRTIGRYFVVSASDWPLKDTALILYVGGCSAFLIVNVPAIGTTLISVLVEVIELIFWASWAMP